MAKLNNNTQIPAIQGLHVAVAWSFAVVQPTFDFLTKNPEYFVTQADVFEILLLGSLLCLIVPIFFIAIELLSVRVGSIFQGVVHYCLLGLFTFAFVIFGATQYQSIPERIIIPLSLSLSGLFCLAYFRFHLIKLYLTILSPAILIFPGIFFLNPMVSRQILHTPRFSNGHCVQKTPYAVVLVVFDEFALSSLLDRDLKIDPIRYPNFSSLAENAKWYRNATGVSDFTTYAVPGILTGRYPSEPRLPSLAEYPQNLFTLLTHSCSLNVMEQSTHFYPKELQTQSRFESAKHFVGITQKLINYVPEILTHDTTGLKYKLLGKLDTTGTLPIRADRFKQFVDSIGTAPTLNFLHIIFPHKPWRYLPSGRGYTFDLEEIWPWYWPDDEWEVSRAYQRYLLQVGFADKLLGDLVSKLKKLETYDQTMLIITADHGVSFKANDKGRTLTETNFQDLTRVPLLIKYPLQKNGAVLDENVETIDILPTIADVLTVPLPWKVDGHSLLDAASAERKKKVFFRSEMLSTKKFEFPAEFLLPYQTVDWKINLFGSGSFHPEWLYGYAPYSKQLVGLNIDEIEVNTDPDLNYQLDNPALFSDVDPKDPEFIPTHIEGTIQSKKPKPDQMLLALAVNGKIRGVTVASSPSEEDELNIRYSFLLPEDSFRDGKNELALFRIDAPEHSSQITLHKISVAPKTH